MVRDSLPVESTALSHGLLPMTNEQHTSSREARTWYIDSRKTELADSTIRAHKYRLSAFVHFCEKHGIDHMNQLSGRHFDRYKIWRRKSTTSTRQRYPVEERDGRRAYGGYQGFGL